MAQMDHVDLWAEPRYLDGRQIVAGLREFRLQPQIGETVTVGDTSGRRIDGTVKVIDAIPGNGLSVEVKLDRSTLRQTKQDSN
jgi:hypothetical protein